MTACRFRAGSLHLSGPAPGRCDRDRIMGRPDKLTPITSERFLQATRAGAPAAVAARWAGFSEASFFRYMAGRTPDHAAFRDEVMKARNELELRLIGVITREAGTKPRWALEILTRRFPMRWGRGGGAADQELSVVRPEDEDELVSLDPAFVETLVPRLLEAERRRRADSSAVIDISGFEERRFQPTTDQDR